MLTRYDIWDRSEDLVCSIDAHSPGHAVEEAVRHGFDLSYADLHGVDLTLTDLNGARLFGANLSGAKFRHAGLVGAVLANTNCYGTDFAHADCRYAQFDNAQFRNVRFGQAKLAETSFRGCDFSRERSDLLSLVGEYAEGVGRLRFALYDGGIDGRCPAPLTCALARVKRCETPYIPCANVVRPVEMFAAGIGLGDTPDSNPLSRRLANWLDQWAFDPLRPNCLAVEVSPRYVYAAARTA